MGNDAEVLASPTAITEREGNPDATLAAIPEDSTALDSDDEHRFADNPDQYLCGKQLLLFEFLSNRKFKTEFNTLEDQKELWRDKTISINGIDSALSRLSKTLTGSNSKWVVDWSRADRWAKVAPRV